MLVPTDEGGRRWPISVGYRGDIQYPGEAGQWMAEWWLMDRDWLEPGEHATAFVWLLSPDEHRARFSPGREFQILEGSRVVGRGRMLRWRDS
jgi:hypothetical protein